MKKYLTIVLLSIFMLSSCNNYLELKPKNQIIAGTMEDIRLMMSSYLFSLSSSDNPAITFNGKRMNWPMNRDVVANFTLYSDDLDMATAMANSYGKKYQPEYFENGDWKGQIFSTLMWNNMYTHIGYLNSVLSTIDQFKGEANYEMVKGEALTIRAYYIFKLLQLYAPYKNDELGIPLNLDPEIITGGTRWTQTNVYKQIIDDLNEALSFNSIDSKWNVFLSKNIIHSLLAQVYMFKAESGAKETDDWKNAEMHSGIIVGQYSLEKTADELISLFSPAANGIYKDQAHALLILAQDITPRSNLYSFWGSGTQLLQPSADLLQSYEENDMRIPAYFNEDARFVKYHFNYDGAADYAVLFRIADLYLINTEANIRLNNPKGKQQLEAFKLNRTGKASSINEADLLPELLKERRKEFCGEYEARWVDMKRFEISVTRKSLDSKTNALVDYTLKSNDYRYALPIPVDSELTYNPTIQQNPEW